MKYIENKQIQKLDMLLRELESEDNNISFIIEAHSCKYTRRQRRAQKRGNVFYDVQNSISLCFPTYTFSLDKNDFRMRTQKEVKNLLFNNLMVFNLVGCLPKVNNIISHINTFINIKKSIILSLEANVGPFKKAESFFCISFYNKKMKKNVLIAGLYKRGDDKAIKI